MRLFADERDLVAPLAPQRDLERHAREHRDQRIDDLVGQAGQLMIVTGAPALGRRKMREMTLAMLSSTTTLPNMKR